MQIELRIAAVLACLGFLNTPAQEDPCINTCAADAFVVMGGQSTAGLTILVGNEINGLGDMFCNTCPGKKCKADVSVSFYSPPGSGMCMSYGDGFSPTNWGGEYTNFSRAGKLKTDCDSVDVMKHVISVHACGSSPSGSSAHEIYLYCPCN